MLFLVVCERVIWGEEGEERKKGTKIFRQKSHEKRLMGESEAQVKLSYY